MMGVLWIKIWHDLWHHKSRTLLSVLSIAAGVFAIGAIFGMVDQMLTGMDAAHRAVAPSHINVILRNYVDKETIDALRDLQGVQDIDPLNQVTVRYKIDPAGEWELGTLVQRDYDNQVFDVVVLKEGEWASNGKINIERLSSQYYGLDMGESVIFDIDGEAQSFELSGKIRHPFVQPPLFGGQAHFFTDAAGLEEFGIPQGYYGQLLVRVDNYNLERSKEVAALIRTELSRRGVEVIVTLYQDPDKHWGRMFVEGITAVLQIMAGVALVLSVILVFNTMTALITQQTDQIGIIKSIGGRRGAILGVYFTQVLLLGVLALLVALPTGSLFAFLMSQWLLNLFNIDHESFVFSQNAVILQILAGLIAPLMAALPPILHGAQMSVREAIATYGLGGDFGRSWLDRLIERFASLFLSSLFAVSLGNMFRRKGRLSLTVLALSISGVMFLIVMTLISSTNLTLDNEQARRGYDLRIGFKSQQTSDMVLSLIQGEAGITAAELWYSRNATLLREGERLEDSAGLGGQLIGIPPGSSIYRPVIINGRWLEAGDEENVVVITQETADKNGLQVGDIITLDLGDLGESEWEVIGTYRVVYGGGFSIEPIYAPIRAVEQVIGETGIGTQALIRAEGVEKLAEAINLEEKLIDRFEAAGIGIDFYTTVVTLEERDYVNNQFASVISTLLGLAMIAATVGAIGLTGALAISVVERTREIGVMRATGAKSGTISSLFLMEGMLHGLLSWVISVPVAYILSQPLAGLLGQRMLELDLDYAFNFPAIFAWLAIVMVFSISASIWPTRAAARIQVRENLSYQ
jgi:putative ABC transport system permease protein